MIGCPSCGRPVALARATCLYCGASLPEASVTAAEQARLSALLGPLSASPPVERLLLGLRLQANQAAPLASALGLPAYDAQRLASRADDYLWRILPVPAAEAEAQRLAQAGLQPWTLLESAVRAIAPQRASGGRREGTSVCLRSGEASGAEWRVAPGDLLLLVQGPIQRESPSPAGQRLVGMASPQPGYRFHLHLRQAERPLELDPDDFELEAGQTGSVLLLLREWLLALAGEAALDDGFRLLAPALAPAARDDGRAARWADSLAQQARGPERRKDDRTLLDNVAQFRFYSAWRGLLARARA